jgi:hypothetical protein
LFQGGKNGWLFQNLVGDSRIFPQRSFPDVTLEFFPGVTDISYAKAMLATITLWLAVAPLAAAGKKWR